MKISCLAEIKACLTGGVDQQLTIETETMFFLMSALSKVNQNDLLFRGNQRKMKKVHNKFP